MRVAAMFVFAILISIWTVTALAQDAAPVQPPGQAPVPNPLPGSQPAQSAPPPEQPPAAPAIFNRALDALDASQPAQAAMDLSLFILLNPTSARAYAMRGFAYEQMDELDQALDDLSLAIELSGGNPALRAFSYRLRGEIYRQQGDSERALSDFARALELDPVPELFAARAMLNLEVANYEEAVADLDQAISRATVNDPTLFYYRARAHDALDRPEDAAADYLQWIMGIQQRLVEQSPVQAGESITLEMGPGAVYSIPFQAEAGETISAVAANLSGDADPLMVLMDPEGNPLLGTDDLPNGDISAVIEGYEVEEEGVYSLLVTHSIAGYRGRVVVLLQKGTAGAS